MLAPGTLYVVCRDKFLYAFKDNDGDLNGDGVVDQPDLLEVVHNLGLCDDPDHCPWDVNGDGIVMAETWQRWRCTSGRVRTSSWPRPSALLANWGPCS